MQYHQVNDKLNIPLINKMRDKYEGMLLCGELEEMCERFGVSDTLLKRMLYSRRKIDTFSLNFDTIIRLSNMFDIPYEEFIDYNAIVVFDKKRTAEEIEEEKELLKQYSVGKQWEDRIIKYYSDRGYFTYKIPTMNSGTVFDILAAKKGSVLMIECKHTDSDKLYYSGSGLLKKRDELDHFINKTQNNIYLYVNSEETGTWWTTWLKAKPIFEEKGYISKEDCYPCNLDNKEVKE